MREPTGKDYVRMGVSIALCAAFCAVMVLGSGCATGRLGLAPVGGHPGVVYVANADGVVDPAAEQPSFLSQHWGKLLAGASAVALGMVAVNNRDWFEGGDKKGGSAGPQEYNGHIVNINGNYNRVNIGGDDVVGDDAMAE